MVDAAPKAVVASDKPAAPNVAGDAAALGASEANESLIPLLTDLERRAFDPSNPDPTALALLADIRSRIELVVRMAQAASASATTVAAAGTSPTTGAPEAAVVATGSAHTGAAAEGAAVTDDQKKAMIAQVLKGAGITQAVGGHTK